MNRIAELSRVLAASPIDEEQCLVWFGVGLATLERIEAGEIEPSEEVARRIDRFLCAAGGGSPDRFQFPRLPLTHCGSQLHAGVPASERDAGAFSPGGGH